MTSALLDLRQIIVSFDGFLALRDLNLSLEPGELRAVIGPNGAGKTTFLDVITGKTAPTSGDVVFKGRSLLGRSEHQIARLGVGRKFQSPRVFEELTVQDNLALAVSQPKSPWSLLFGRLKATERDRIQHRHRQRALIGLQAPCPMDAWPRSRCLWVRPDLLLVEEPVAD